MAQKTEAVPRGLSVSRLHLAALRKRLSGAENWRVENGGVEGHTVLRIHHPGMGWITFILADEEARRLADELGQAGSNPP